MQLNDTANTIIDETKLIYCYDCEWDQTKEVEKERDEEEEEELPKSKYSFWGRWETQHIGHWFSITIRFRGRDIQTRVNYPTKEERDADKARIAEVVGQRNAKLEKAGK